MALTYSNRTLYSSLIRRARLSESRVQMARIRLGIADIVPMSELFRLFTWQELRSMVCGEVQVDIAMLKKHTSYSGEFDTTTTTSSSSSSGSGGSGGSGTSETKEQNQPLPQAVQVRNYYGHSILLLLVL